MRFPASSAASQLCANSKIPALGLRLPSRNSWATHTPFTYPSKGIALDVVIGPLGFLLLCLNLRGVHIQNHFFRLRLQTLLHQSPTDLLDGLRPRLALSPQPVPHRPGARHRLQAQLLSHLALLPQLPQVLQAPPPGVQHPHQRCTNSRGRYPRPDFGPCRTRSTSFQTPRARANSSKTTSPPKLVRRSELLSILIGRTSCGKLCSIVHPHGVGIWSLAKPLYHTSREGVRVFGNCQSRFLGGVQITFAVGWVPAGADLGSRRPDESLRRAEPNPSRSSASLQRHLRESLMGRSHSCFPFVFSHCPVFVWKTSRGPLPSGTSSNAGAVEQGVPHRGGDRHHQVQPRRSLFPRLSSN